jgi:hypothetical protein
MLNDGTTLDTRIKYRSIKEINPLPDFVLGSDSSYTKSVIDSYGGSCLTCGKTLDEWKQAVKPNKLRKLEKDELEGFVPVDFIEEFSEIELWAEEDATAQFWLFGFFHMDVCFHTAHYSRQPSFHSRLEFVRYVLGSHKFGIWNNLDITDGQYIFRIAESKKGKFTSIIPRDSYLSANTASVHVFVREEALVETDFFSDSRHRCEPYGKFLALSEDCDEGFASYLEMLDHDRNNLTSKREIERCKENLSSLNAEISRILNVELKKPQWKSIFIATIFATILAVVISRI